MAPPIPTPNLTHRNGAAAKRGKAFRYRWRSALAAACAARLATAFPAVHAAPVILEDVTDAPTTESPTPFTGNASDLGFNPSNAPIHFVLKIDDPNNFGGNYRFYTTPAGSLGSTQSWDYGDYKLRSDVAHYDDSGHAIVTGVQFFTVAQALPTSTDSIVFGYLGPDRTFLSPDRDPASYPGMNAYTVNLGGQTYAETIAGFFGQPAGSSVTLNLGGTYVSTHAARLEGQRVIMQGSGVLGSNDTIYVAGTVTVNAGSLIAPTVIIDNDHDYLSRPPSAGAPGYGSTAPTSTTLTLDGATAKINTTTLIVADQSTNGPATLLVQNGASVTTQDLEAGNAANTDGRITIDNSTLTATGAVDIGVDGKGTLTIQNGGAVKITGADSNLTLAFDTGSTGTLTVTGASSSLTTDGSILVGGGGSAGEGGTGTMTVSLGAAVTSKDSLYVGNSGAATDLLTISGGSVVTSSAASGDASDYSGVVGSKIFTGTATATITGAQSMWDNKQSLSLGAHGTATLTVSDGGTLQVEGSIIDLGHYEGGDGTLTFDRAGGANPTFTFSGGDEFQLIIGDAGTGQFTVKGGAQIATGTDVLVGNQTTGTGHITLQDTGSSWTIDGDLKVAVDGTGTVQVGAGTTLTNNNAYIGSGAQAHGSVTVDGQGAQWTNHEYVFLGFSGPAVTDTIAVRNGGNVTIEKGLAIGGTPTTGTQPSTGNGLLTILSGGKVTTGTQLSATDSAAFVGAGANSKGTVLIDGPGSSWEVKGRLGVGASAGSVGAITVQNGATLQVEGDVFSLGIDPKGTGTLTFDKAGGANPTFTFTGGTNSQLLVGDGGTGNLFVQGGAQITTGVSVIAGAQANSTGTITVQDPNSSWTINGTLTLGANGSGSLTIGDGGTVTVGALAFTTQVGSSATVEIEGTGNFIDLTDADFNSNGPGYVTLAHDQGGGLGVAVTGDIGQKVGGDGSTTFDIKNGGQMEVDGRPLVLDASSGTVNITIDGTGKGGASALIVNNHSIVVGYSPASQSNTATLKITGGGDVESAQSVIGRQAGSSGSVLISGANSQWNIKVVDGQYALTIGDLGTGTLQVADGASFTSAGIALGSNVDHSQPTSAYGKGTLSVIGTGGSGTQTSLTTNGPLTIGDFGQGIFSASAGAQIVTNGAVTIGSRTDKDAPVSSATISDPGTSWTITPAGDSIILQVHAGTLTVANGAKLDASAGTTLIGNTQVGNSTSGILTVTGDDSKAAFGHVAFQGGQNNGTPVELQILAGGAATLTNFTDASGSGMITVTGHSTTGSPSKLELSEWFDVFGGESLQLNISADALFNLLGNQNADGAPGNFVVRGTLQVTGGGTVQDTNGQVTIGGPTTVSGSGTKIVASTLLIGPVVSGGTPQLTVGTGASLQIDKSVTIAAGGTVDLTGGGTMTIAASGYVPAPGGVLVDPQGVLKINGALNVGSPVMIADGASVGGGGTINGQVVNGGRTAPGDPQTLTINGDYTQLHTGTLDLQIAGTGAGNADKLVVTGKATLDGFLELDFINGFAPQVGDTFDLLTLGSTAGQFAHVQITGLEGGWTFTLAPNGGALELISTSNAVFLPEFIVPFGPNTILTGVTADQTVHFLGGILEATVNTSLGNPVILDLNGGTFQADPGTASFLSGIISGPGTFTKTGTGALTLTAANTYTGNTYINEGSLFLDGSLASPNVYVLFGALLGGNGTLLGNLFNAGTVSPGHSPGEIQVKGNYVQSPTGLLKIEIGGREAGQHDLLAIGGTATLDGALQLVRLNHFKLKRNAPVTFLTAAGGVNGRFSTVLSDFTSDSILQPTVVYQPNSVALEAVQGSFGNFAAGWGLSSNQKSVAHALDSLPVNRRTHSLFDYLDYRPLSKLPGDFDQIAPEELTSMFTIATSLAQVQSGNIQRRTDDIRCGTSGFSAAGLAVNGTGPSYSGAFGLAGPSGPFSRPVPPTADDGKDVKEDVPVSDFNFQDWGVFLSGTGEWVSVGNTDNARGYDLSSGGFTLGIDYKVTPNFAIGLAAGYTGTSADLVDRGRVYVNGGKIGLYATFFQNEPAATAPTMSKDSSKEAPAPTPSLAKGFYADLAVFGGYNNYDTRRSALQGKARGDTDGGELNALFGAGYDIKKGNLTFGPTASFNYTYLGTNEFTEHGSLAPLNIHGGKGESLRTAFGLKASYDWRVGGILIKPEIRAAWQHEYGDAAYALDSSFANGAGHSFLVNGPQLGRDSALVGAGFAVQFNERMSTYFYYDGELGRKNYQSNSVTGGFRVTF